MPLIGLTDRKGDNIIWDDIKRGKGDFEDAPPLLLALMPNRERYCDFSVTELNDDCYHQQLQRRVDYFESPDDIFDRLMGSAFHSLMESCGLKGIEQRMVRTIKIKVAKGKLKGKVIKVTVGGTCDLIYKDQLWDYKTLTTSKLGMVSRGILDFDDYYYQINLYRWLYWKETGKEIKKLYLRFAVRDWRFYEYRRKGYDIKKYPKGCIEKVKPVPLKRIQEDLITRVVRHVSAERVSDKRLHTVGECDTWKDYLRCEFYCGVKEQCWFYQQRTKKGK